VDAFRQFSSLVVDGLRSHYRDGQLVFWNYVFFLVLLLLFVGTLGRDPSVRVVLVCGIVTIAVMGTALFSVGIGMSAARDRGVYRRLAMLPVTTSVVLWAAVVARWVVAVTSAAVLVLVARAAFGVDWPGGLLTWVVAVAAGAAAFCAIGFALAGLAPSSHRANAGVNAVFIPMLLFSGAALPVGLLPAWLAPISAWLPSTALVQMLQGAVIRGDQVTGSLAFVGNMAAWTIGAGLLGAAAWNRRGVM
jgi:ABC-2 type transport system permease protein